MKSYKFSLCAMVLLAFLTIGISGCCWSKNPGGGWGSGWFSNAPQNQGPRTVEEFVRQPKPGANLKAL